MLTKIRVSDYIYPLQDLGYLGQIHSVFASSFNLKIGAQLVHVSHQEDYLSSFGLLMTDADYHLCQPYLQVGNLVKISEDELTIYSRKGCYHLPLSYEVVSLRLPSLSIEGLKERLLWLKSYLERTVKQDTGLTLPQEMEQFLVKKKVSSKELEELVAYLIGRGKGLTPSGDDILVAYLSLMFSCHQERFQQLLPIVLNRLSHTTDVSQAYLRACLKGYASSPICRFYHTLCQTHFDKKALISQLEFIKAIGHTSGADMLLGLWFGLCLIV